MRPVATPELVAALERRGGRSSVRRLEEAVRRAEANLAQLSPALGLGLPADVRRTLDLPGRSGTGLAVDTAQVARLTAPRLASLPYAAAVESIATDATLDVPTDPPPAPRRDARDEDALLMGVEPHALEPDEVLVHYRPRASIPRSRSSVTAREGVAVEERVAAALEGIPDGEVVDSSGWTWTVLLP